MERTKEVEILTQCMPSNVIVTGTDRDPSRMVETIQRQFLERDREIEHLRWLVKNNERAILKRKNEVVCAIIGTRLYQPADDSPEATQEWAKKIAMATNAVISTTRE